MGKAKILIVEDEGNMRTMLALELESSGYEVSQAEDGVAGYKAAMENKPDLIISDILMPQMDGNQLMKKLRENEETKNIPFIVLTARGQMHDYFEMMEVDDFIAKPFEAEDLMARVEKALSKIKQRKEGGAAPAAAPATEGAGSGSSDGGGKKILLLESEEAEAENFNKVLTDKGYDVMAVKTVPESLEGAVTFKPDAVITRFLLEGMNADKLVSLLKGMPHLKDVPVLVYSQKAKDWEEKSVLEAGAFCFIGEVNGEKLIEALGKARV